MKVLIAEAEKQIEIHAKSFLISFSNQGPIPSEDFELWVKKATGLALSCGKFSILNEENIDQDRIIKKLQKEFDIQISDWVIFPGKEYSPWVEKISGKIDWYYWERYRQYIMKKLPQKAVLSLDDVTDQIVDHLENPRKEGSWDRRGMVVGHVQSGKTANYTGVICKAADAGYKVIIVLAGMLNSLRSQTQERINSGFIGRSGGDNDQGYVGVGQIDHARFPISFTTIEEDFCKSFADRLVLDIGQVKEPIVFVVKKNTSALGSLISWLKTNNPHQLQDYPMLLVDDEADNASINTKIDGVTAINGKIRTILDIFSRSSYLGYTATPFANIFIDPDSNDEMNSDDLFPKDFILNLGVPDNYIGARQIFVDEAKPCIVREIDDYDSELPLDHKIDAEVESLPKSLEDAIITFVLIRAIRIKRHQIIDHNSMMVNVSRFTDVQSQVKLLIKDFLKNKLRCAIHNYSSLPQDEAIRNSVISRIHDVWVEEFSNTEFSWERILPVLDDAVGSIGVIEVNGSRDSESLVYDRNLYPYGRNVIAVGGMSLARGLTLEGLTVSYFLRKSVMYDTLMQMGRWFGYRVGYSDLCRIFMTEEAAGWYSHISGVTEEFRAEIDKMKAANMTPKDYGLCVRAHPETLIVTARNKMRSGKTVVRSISLAGRLVETKSLRSESWAVDANWGVLKRLLDEVTKSHGFESNVGKHYIWRDINWGYIKNFISDFHNAISSEHTESGPLIEHGEYLYKNGYPKWDVLLMNPQDPESEMPPFRYLDLSVNFQKRTVKKEAPGYIMFPRRRVATGEVERLSLSSQQIEELKSLEVSLSDANCRSKRNKPLLILHLLDCYIGEESLVKTGVVAWGASFPGEAGRGRPKKLVSYVVNTIWWNKHYDEYEDEELKNEKSMD